MKHEIQIEQFVRDSDGHEFVRVVMRDLAGADRFEIVCRGETTEGALLELAHRLRLAASDAFDISGKLFDKYWNPPVETNSSSQDYPALKVVDDRDDKEEIID